MIIVLIFAVQSCFLVFYDMIYNLSDFGENVIYY